MLSPAAQSRINHVYTLTGTVIMAKPTTLTVQKWGNSLAVRIPAAVARSARFTVGQPVELSMADDGVLVKPVGGPTLTLAQKLAAFDPHRHGGEAMATRPVGGEAW
jgi:antitoxin MazE